MALTNIDKISILCAAAFMIFVSLCEAYPTYKSNIPNGFSVPDPCPGVRRTFPAVGHWKRIPHEASSFGLRFDAFARNPFGMDYQQIRNWTELCWRDSDGDGRSNGEELGDPDCIWQKGDNPSGPAVSHPGIKEDLLENNITKINWRDLRKVNCDIAAINLV